VVQSLNAQVEEEQGHKAVKNTTNGYPLTFDESPDPITLEDDNVEDLDNRFGKLVVDKGRSRYISSHFWANLNGEVRTIKAML